MSTTQTPTKKRSASKIDHMSVEQLFDILESGEDVTNPSPTKVTKKRTKRKEEMSRVSQPRLDKSMKKTQPFHVMDKNDVSEESTNHLTDRDLNEKEETDENAPLSSVAIWVDRELLQSVQEQVEHRKCLRVNITRMVKIFRAGCMIIESNQLPTLASTATTLNKASADKKKATISNRKGHSVEEMHLSETGFISNSVHFLDLRVYQNSMKLCLELIPKSLDFVLGVEDLDKLDKMVLDDPKSLERWKVEASKKWKSLRAPMKVFFYYLRLLLETISNEGMKRYLLKVARRCSPYLLKLVKFARAWIKSVISTWAYAEEESTRAMAYFTLYCWSLFDSDRYLPNILKKMQSTFKDEVAKQGNLRRLPVVLFAANSLVDLFGMDMGISYSSIFVHLRELAIVLKRVITSEGKEFRYLVENWQFINQLRLYGMVLSSYPQKDQLRTLIYPYVQIVLGVLNFSYSPNCFGLLFHCIHFLNDLMKQANIYIPLASSLTRVLFCAELKKKPTSNEVKDKPLIWRTTLRIPEKQLNTRAFRDGVVSQVVYLLAEHFSILSRNVAFPELIVPTVISLNDFMKETKVSKFRQIIKELTQQMEENANLIRKLRRQSNCGPTQLKSETLCSPLGFPSGERTPMEMFLDLEQQRLIKEEKLLTSTVIDLEESWTLSNNTPSKEEQMKRKEPSYGNAKDSVSNDEDWVEELVLTE
ncbi:hypothetical protein GpartN1_g1550.t1 [Galdieria partita]|uniref:Nucleolar complex protein 2 homolog n=1 Tax=Galdieria partita TaxID=83374 RepID=A0A9C7UNB7_9RHOD|nr:hypothetical protein GpartN1_g1550.t1 [Galdieria partita]